MLKMNHCALIRASAPQLPLIRSNTPTRFFITTSHSHISFGHFIKHLCSPSVSSNACGYDVPSDGTRKRDAPLFCFMYNWCSYYLIRSKIRHNATENFAIEGRNLNFSIKTKQGTLTPILKDCSLQIPSGQFWMLLGPNGCGKSTLLKILAGLLSPADGFIQVRKPKSFVFQNPDHQEMFYFLQVVMPTVEADVAFGLGKYNLTPDQIKYRVAKALEAVSMYEYVRRPVQTLSGGQKQRIAIAGALADACRVLLLDELTTFLDENDQVGVIKAVKNSLASSEDVTALWVTHRLEELEYADGAVYMEDGRVVMHGDVSSIMDFIDARKSSYNHQISS